MSRYDLTDSQWLRIQPDLPDESHPKRGGQWKPHRLIINGILWILRTGAPWRDLPERYGPWSTVHTRFLRWQREGLWDSLLASIQQEEEADGHIVWEVGMIDASYVRAHQHAVGARHQPARPARKKGGRKRTSRLLPSHPTQPWGAVEAV